MQTSECHPSMLATGRGVLKVLEQVRQGHAVLIKLDGDIAFAIVAKHDWERLAALDEIGPTPSRSLSDT
jgi:hypothetical protein